MPKRRAASPPPITHEATSYADGLFNEFHQQVHRYLGLTGELLTLEGRIELAEKTLCLMRDHLAMTLAQTETAAPRDWKSTFESVRFVGVRLADACMTLLQQHKKLTPERLLEGLNTGMFRFRTSSPLREIHAALLRQRRAKKIGNSWVWMGDGAQIPLRLRVVKTEPIPVAQFEENEDGTKA